MQYPTFDDWYQEQEGYALRAERLTSNIKELQAAFEAGRATVDQCHKCNSISGVYLQICDHCMTKLNILEQKTNNER